MCYFGNFDIGEIRVNTFPRNELEPYENPSKLGLYLTFLATKFNILVLRFSVGPKLVLSMIDTPPKFNKYSLNDEFCPKTSNQPSVPATPIYIAADRSFIVNEISTEVGNPSDDHPNSDDPLLTDIESMIPKGTLNNPLEYALTKNGEV